jgi:hypothetical protein
MTPIDRRATASVEAVVSGDELQPRALPPECDCRGGGDAVVVRVEERID